MKTCSFCGKKDDEALFRSGRNQCLGCYKQYLKDYRKQNAQALKIKRNEGYKNNPEKKKHQIKNLMKIIKKIDLRIIKNIIPKIRKI